MPCCARRWKTPASRRSFAREHGLRIWKVGLAWPLDAEAARAFAEGLEEILVIEDRRPVIEPQLRDALFHAPVRPRVTGKKDENGRPLLSDLTELDIGQILRALAARLPAPLRTNRLHERIAELDAAASLQTVPLHLRDPYFCPGCPHNTSTRIPDGSRALAGIGCHYLGEEHGPEFRPVHPDGRGGHALDRPGALHQ